MPTPTLQQIYDAARGYLHDDQVSGGEVWTNTALQVHFNEAYRRMWRAMGNSGSKRVQKIVELNLPAVTTVLIPSTYQIMDFSEPELIEERPVSGSKTIVSTDTSTPIRVTITAHGLGANGSEGYGMISSVASTTAPWGFWGFTVVDANTISLNGSASDGTAGTGGTFTINSVQIWSQVLAADFAGQCVDGQPGQFLGCYIWNNEQLQFRGAVNPVQLRITYWSSGAPPTLSNQSLGIDDCVDLVACITASNAASANGWYPLADRLANKAYGSSQDPDISGGMLNEFLNNQIKTRQRGPIVRNYPFRRIRSRWGANVIGG